MTEEETTSEWFEGILDPSKYILFDFGQGTLVPMDEIEQVVVRENGELECWPSIVSESGDEK